MGVLGWHTCLVFGSGALSGEPRYWGPPTRKGIRVVTSLQLQGFKVLRVQCRVWGFGFKTDGSGLTVKDFLSGYGGQHDDCVLAVTDLRVRQET